MKLGVRKYLGASLKLSKPKALPTHMQGDYVELSDVFTRADQRGNGQAGELLMSVGLDADLNRKLLLIAVDDMALSPWYAKHGFVPVQTEPALLMVRPHVGMKARQGDGGWR